MNRRITEQGSAVTITLIIVLILGILTTLGYVAYSQFLAPKAEEVPSIADEQTITSLKTFQTESRGITFQYPEDWTVSEAVNESSTEDYYQTLVTVKNADGDTVAQLGTGGGVGGACLEDSPLQNIETTIKNTLTLNKFEEAAFGYTIVQRTDGTFSATYGLMKDMGSAALSLGTGSVRCPGMAVNYQYMVRGVDDLKLGSMTFGLWYREQGASVSGGIGNLSFMTLEEAKAYADSAEFKQIQAMVESTVVQ